MSFQGLPYPVSVTQPQTHVTLLIILKDLLHTCIKAYIEILPFVPDLFFFFFRENV